MHALSSTQSNCNCRINYIYSGFVLCLSDRWVPSGNALLQLGPLLQRASPYKCGGIRTCVWDMFLIHARLSSTHSNHCNHRINYICIGFVLCLSDRWVPSGNALLQLGPLLQRASPYKCGGIRTCVWDMFLIHARLSSTHSNHCNHRINYICIGFVLCLSDRWVPSGNALLHVRLLQQRASPQKCGGIHTCIWDMFLINARTVLNTIKSLQPSD